MLEFSNPILLEGAESISSDAPDAQSKENGKHNQRNEFIHSKETKSSQELKKNVGIGCGRESFTVYEDNPWKQERFDKKWNRKYDSRYCLWLSRIILCLVIFSILIFIVSEDKFSCKLKIRNSLFSYYYNKNPPLPNIVNFRSIATSDFIYQ